MQGYRNSTSIIPITLSFLFLFISNFGDVFAAPTNHLCRHDQRDALLELKNKLEIKKPCFDSLKMDSWVNNSDCCYWDGITCDAKSGEVVELDLSESCLYSRFHSKTSLFGLQNLHSLTTLNLSFNHFNGSVPFSIGSLSHLTTLKLQFNNFSGRIPSCIGNLSHLTTLDLSYNSFSGIPSSFGKLSNLTTLDLSSNDFMGQIPSSIGNLSHLIFLDLSSNNFSGQILPSIGNFSHLTSLDLSINNLAGEVPFTFGNLNQLTSLGLDFNKLSGDFPTALLNLTKLSYLKLSYNQFTGMLPPNLTLLSNLESFEARDNAFVRTLPSSLFTIPSLDTLILSNNQLHNTREFANISSSSKLRVLRLGSNNFKGPIPSSISRLANLAGLELSNFNTQGPIDLSIFLHLKSLEFLLLPNLNTTTTIDLNAFVSRFKKLDALDLSGNHVSTTNKSSVSDPPSQSIMELNLSGCGITEFPELLRTHHKMFFLDISNNKIKGQVPGWLWTLPRFWHVDLSKNNFTGFEMPTKPRLSPVPKPFLRFFFGSNNNFTGKIPSFFCDFRSLEFLDISDNNFTGLIPPCMENLKSTLSVLNLRQNRLSGGLPESIFESLKSLDVGNNQLVGKLPRSLLGFSSLQVLNVESNRINDTFPSWLSSLPELQVLVMRSNAFHGPLHQTHFPKLRIIDISHNHFTGTLQSDFFAKWTAMLSLGEYEEKSTEKYMGSGYYRDSMVLMNKGVALELVRILKIFTALDISGNKFEGEIPRSVGLLKELHVLNLSNNAFTGHIPSSMGNLKALESLDVSQNKLSGEIPQELGSLSYLAYMNFSHNQLVGLVPGGTQFRTQPCSSFQDNSGLFGPSLDEICNDIHPPPPQPYETPEPEEEDEEVLSWKAAAIGFGPGIVLGLTIGYILASYKPGWFMNPFGRSRRKGTTTH